MIYRTYVIDELDDDKGVVTYVVYASDWVTQVGEYPNEAAAKAEVDRRIGNRRWEWKRTSSNPETSVCLDTTNGRELGRIVEVGYNSQGFWFEWRVANGKVGDRLERRWDAKTYVEREIIAAKLL